MPPALSLHAKSIHARSAGRHGRRASATALLLALACVLAAGCELERPYDPLDEYEEHVWTAATAGLQKLPQPGVDDDKPWPFEAHGLWPLFTDRQYFDGTTGKSLAYPLWSAVTTPDGLQLNDVFFVYRDARRQLPGGLVAQRTNFLWPLFEYRNKAWETDYRLFPIVFWTSQIFPDARLHDRDHPEDTLPLTPLPEPSPLDTPAAPPTLGQAWLPPTAPGMPARSRSSLTRLMRPFDPARDHTRDRLWIFPIFFFGNDSRLGVDIALFPLGGSISNFIGKERVWYFAFPLWAKTHEAAYDAQHILWPLFAWWDGPGTNNGPGGNPGPGGRQHQDRRHGFRFLPLYSQDTWDNREFRYSILWPFWTSEDIGLDTKYPTHVRSFFPFWASSQSPRHQLTSWLVIFSKMNIFYNNGDWARTVYSIWPLFSITYGDVGGFRFFPLFESRDDGESYYMTLLWPLFRADHNVSYRETSDTFQFLLDPLSVLNTINSTIAGSAPLGQTEASQSPGFVQQTWWEVRQPHGDPVRFGREFEANAFYNAEKLSHTWYEEGRVGKYWGPDAEDLPPTNQALRYLFKDGPAPPIQAELAAKLRQRLGLASPQGPGFFGAEGTPSSDGTHGTRGNATTPDPNAPPAFLPDSTLPTSAPPRSGPARVPPRGPLAYPLGNRKRTLEDLEEEAALTEPGHDWMPTPPVKLQKTNENFWPIYHATTTQRNDFGMQLLNPIFFPDADGAIESQWGALWNLYLYQNSADSIGRERALLTWWRRDWNGPARHTELVGIFDYWRIDDQPDRAYFTLAGGWLWEGYASPRRSFHGNILFALGTQSGRANDWWFLNGLLGHDHTKDGQRTWRILWMRF